MTNAKLMKPKPTDSTTRRRMWYRALGPEKKEEVKARMREYYHLNKERLNANIKKRRNEARLRKAADKPDS